MQQDGNTNGNNLFHQPDKKQQSATAAATNGANGGATTQIVISRNLIKPAESAPTSGINPKKITQGGSQVVET